jgi:hypothetical protein
MARSDALATARRAYERAHVLSGLRGLALGVGLAFLAVGLHRTSNITWLVAAALAATLATLGWRGGAYRRGALGGVIAGLPPMLAPAIVFALGHGGHCPDCQMQPTLTCMLTCFGTSSLVGILVGRYAASDPQARRFGGSAIATAMLTGLLGCATVGFTGALGVIVGLVAGSVTGWVMLYPRRA